MNLLTVVVSIVQCMPLPGDDPDAERYLQSFCAMLRINLCFPRVVSIYHIPTRVVFRRIHTVRPALPAVFLAHLQPAIGRF